MYPIDTALEKKLTESLHLYYDSLRSADLKSLRSVMEDESYFSLLEMMSFKHVFHDASFKVSLEAMQSDALALKKVEDAVSSDLKKRVQGVKIKVRSLESKGSDRAALHYSENDNIKKMYFSYSEENWKIDSRAGRKKL
ncbi:MAG: hypothetical protein H8E76_02090 [Helicobacteraceae bacterium]|nr:hypothetical protein [Candidatus Sulfurimonas ponti]